MVGRYQVVGACRFVSRQIAKRYAEVVIELRAGTCAWAWRQNHWCPE